MSYSQFPNYYETPGSSSVAAFTDPSSTYTYEPGFFDSSRPAPAPRQGGVAGFIKGVGEFAEKITPLAQEIADLIVEYKVEECNAKRAAIISKYAALAKEILDSTQTLENEIIS